MDKVSIVVTVKNDLAGENRLMDLLARQTKKPDQIIVVRAEENNNCSRAVGRNIGINKATNHVIAITDVGCDPHDDWLEKLTEKIDGQSAMVVAGFYRVRSETALQQALAPFLAVLPGQWTNDYFPASRSIALTKSAWEIVGGYPEEAEAAAEDIVFASRLFNHPQIQRIQAPGALVDWEPPRTLGKYLGDIRDHTLGNFQANYRPHIRRNLLVVARWILFILAPWLFVPYLAWPIVKHWKQLNRNLWELKGRADRLIYRNLHEIKGQTLISLILQPVVQVMTDVVIIVTIAQWAVSKLWSKALVGWGRSGR